MDWVEGVLASVTTSQKKKGLNSNNLETAAGCWVGTATEQEQQDVKEFLRWSQGERSRLVQWLLEMKHSSRINSVDTQKKALNPE